MPARAGDEGLWAMAHGEDGSVLEATLRIIGARPPAARTRTRGRPSAGEGLASHPPLDQRLRLPACFPSTLHNCAGGASSRHELAPAIGRPIGAQMRNELLEASLRAFSDLAGELGRPDREARGARRARTRRASRGSSPARRPASGLHVPHFSTVLTFAHLVANRAHALPQCLTQRPRCRTRRGRASGRPPRIVRAARLDSRASGWG